MLLDFNFILCYAFFMIKKQWKTGRALTRVEQLEFMRLAKHEQDLKNNKNFENPFYKPTSNSATLERGVPNDKLINSLGGR